jgi:hypothetical protein
VAPEPGRPNKGKIIQFANSQIGSGASFVTVTNLSNSKSINLSISGPGQFNFVDGVFTMLGPRLDILPPNVVPPDLPPVSFAQGRTVVQFDDLGNVLSVGFTGTAKNLCELVQ